MLSIGIQLITPYYFEGQVSLLNDVAIVAHMNNNPWATALTAPSDLGHYHILSGGN